MAGLSGFPSVDGNVLEGVSARPPLDRIGFVRRIRPSITLLEFGT